MVQILTELAGILVFTPPLSLSLSLSLSLTHTHTHSAARLTVTLRLESGDMMEEGEGAYALIRVEPEASATHARASFTAVLARKIVALAGALRLLASLVQKYAY